MNSILFGQLRALAAAAGGVLVTLGIVDAGTWEVVTGAILTIGSAAWSAIEKLRAPAA